MTDSLSLIGQTISHYRIIEKIGAGGTGEVYRARDEHLDREVAIKVLPKRTFIDEHARKLLHKEAVTLSKLNHSHIATIYDFDTQQGLDFLVMEYVSGETLSQHLSASVLSEKEVTALGLQIVQALEEAHEHGIIHRDLKPANIAITSKGQVKVLDFGLAKLFDPTRGGLKAETLTQSVDDSHLIGTLPYMAPEQVNGEHIDARADIWAAGCVVYEMATHQRPFREESTARLFDSILHQVVVAPRALNPRISPEMERIILKCLEKEPENRYQSAKELAIDLQRLQRETYAGSSKTEAHHGQSPRRPLSRWRLVALISASILVLAVAAAKLWHEYGQGGSPTVTTASIAVLPFADLSPNHDQEYFSDGLAEEILNDLTKIPNLKVVARTSAFQFKGENEDLQVIRQKLNVENVLEGSVRREGNRVRITAQLISAHDGFHLWSESYDRDLNDVLTVQDGIAKAVTAALQLKLLPGKSAAILPTSRTTSPEAYQDFLQARYFATRRDKASQQKALEYINEAIQADPHYAAVYAFRATLRVTSGAGGWTQYSEAIENARRDIEKAIELDPNLADAYRVLSVIQFTAESNCRAAEVTLRRALELAPGNADNLSSGALIANCLGHQEEAVGVLRQALALDPLAAGLYLQLAQYLRDLRRYDESHAALEKVLELNLNPHQVWTHETRGEVYLAQGRPWEALAEMEKEPPGCLHDLGMALAYHALGRHGESDTALAEINSQGSIGCAYQIAQVYAYRGEMDHAFEWLNRAYGQHDGGLCMFKTDLLLNNIRGDPRYGQMLKTLNLAN